MWKTLAILLVTVTLCACQAQPTGAPPLPTAPVQASAVPNPTTPVTSVPLATRTPSYALGVNPADLRGVTISLWHPLFGDSASAVKSITEDFNQNNIWGIRVNIGALNNLTTLEETLQQNITGGKLPQVVLAPAYVIADWQTQKSLFTPIAPFLKDTQWGLATKELEDIPAAFLPDPQLLSLPVARTASVLFYNVTWAKELGYRNPPTTPEEFRIQACAASKANLNDVIYENDGLGGWYIDRDAHTLLSWMEAFNANPIHPQTNALKFNTTPAANAFTFLRKLLESACAWVSPTTTALDAFNRRQALFISGTLEDLLSQEKIQKLAKNSDDWSILPYPSENNSPSVYVSGLDGAILNGKPAEQLAGWLYLRWLLLPRSQAALAAAGATLPVRSSALALMADFARLHPQWSTATGLVTQFKPAPQIPQWRIAHRVLEDAAWQVFQPYVPATRIPGILAEVDSTLQELIQRQP